MCSWGQNKLNKHKMRKKELTSKQSQVYLLLKPWCTVDSAKHGTPTALVVEQCRL